MESRAGFQVLRRSCNRRIWRYCNAYPFFTTFLTTSSRTRFFTSKVFCGLGAEPSSADKAIFRLAKPERFEMGVCTVERSNDEQPRPQMHYRRLVATCGVLTMTAQGGLELSGYGQLLARPNSAAAPVSFIRLRKPAKTCRVLKDKISAGTTSGLEDRGVHRKATKRGRSRPQMHNRQPVRLLVGYRPWVDRWGSGSIGL